MTYYRLYFLGGPSGPILNVREFEVDDDPAAIGAAERLRGMAAMELWSGGRKVRHWEQVGAARAYGAASAMREFSSSLAAGTPSRLA